MSNRMLTGSLALIGLACGGGVVNHADLGDRAYLAGEFGTALSEYRLGLAQSPSPSLRIRAAMAALNGGELIPAAAEFRALVAESEDRSEEAADGLERVAQAAVAAGNSPALEEALAGLLEVSEGRGFGSFAQQLAADLGETPQTSEALNVLLYAAVGAPDVGQQDSLLLVYGQVLWRLRRCEEAAGVFESLVRRGRNRRVEDAARNGAVQCLLALGQTDLDRGFPENAEAWYGRAAIVGGETPAGRAAYVGIGDVRVALGDYLAAQSAYEQARNGLILGDSLYMVVQGRINAIINAGTVFR